MLSETASADVHVLESRNSEYLLLLAGLGWGQSQLLGSHFTAACWGKYWVLDKAFVWLLTALVYMQVALCHFHGELIYLYLSGHDQHTGSPRELCGTLWERLKQNSAQFLILIVKTDNKKEPIWSRGQIHITQTSARTGVFLINFLWNAAGFLLYSIVPKKGQGAKAVMMKYLLSAEFGNYLAFHKLGICLAARPSAAINWCHPFEQIYCGWRWGSG